MEHHVPRLVHAALSHAPLRPPARRAVALTALAAAGLVLAGVLAPRPASALVLEMSVERMSASAARVVYGEVTSVTPRMDPDGSVITEAGVRVLRGWKGAHAPEVRIAYPGGAVGPVTVVVPDAPVLTPGQRALFFLDGQGRPLAWGESVLHVRGGKVARERQTLEHVEARIEAAAELPPSAVPETPTGAALLESAPEAASVPSISGFSPASASAGTGSRVTISGAGFGSSAGSVEFFYRSGRPAIKGKVSSWSDSRIEVTVPVGLVDGYPASAGSGPVTVRTAGGATATRDFHVTFGFGGNRWPVTEIPFKVDPNGPVSGTRAAVDGAAATWSAAGGAMLRDVGTTSVGAPRGGDGNTISWAALPSGVLGQASMRYYAGEMIETDFAFNSAYGSWGDGSSGTVDLQSVALHEMGHWLDLRDLYGPGDSGKVMRGIIGSGVRRRVLTADDAAGVRFAYGPPPQTVPLRRIYGSDRYATSVAVSRSAFPAAGTVVLATGEDFPDALAASGLAGSYRGPLLLTARRSLPTVVRSEIVRLKATRVVVVGSGRAVDSAVARAVAAIPGVTVERVYGADRYATAAAVAKRIAAREGPRSEAFLVRGDSFADALAVAPYAYSQRMPVLLSARSGLPSATRSAIGSVQAANVVVAGSSSAVPGSVVSALSTQTRRVSGPDRYSTASAMVAYAISRGWTAPESVAVATGLDFPDALGGGAAVGSAGGAMLLTSPTSLSGPSAQRLAATKSSLRSVSVLGSTRAVSSAVVSQISLTLR